jgi:hypothetical protein
VRVAQRIGVDRRLRTVTPHLSRIHGGREVNRARDRAART